MKPFKFLDKIRVKLPEDVEESCIKLSMMGTHYFNTCKKMYLEKNPHLDPINDDYAFPLPHIELSQKFHLHKTKLCYFSHDFNEHDDSLSHYLFYDDCDEERNLNYFVTVTENSDGSFYIQNVELG